MGATSFVKVILRGAAALVGRSWAAERNATARTHTPAAAIFMGVPSLALGARRGGFPPAPRLLDDDLDEPVRPAALRMAGDRHARRVVGAHADEIVARSVERRLRG